MQLNNTYKIAQHHVLISHSCRM